MCQSSPIATNMKCISLDSHWIWEPYLFPPTYFVYFKIVRSDLFFRLQLSQDFACHSYSVDPRAPQVPLDSGLFPAYHLSAACSSFDLHLFYSLKCTKSEIWDVLAINMWRWVSSMIPANGKQAQLDVQIETPVLLHIVVLWIWFQGIVWSKHVNNLDYTNLNSCMISEPQLNCLKIYYTHLPENIKNR